MTDSDRTQTTLRNLWHSLFGKPDGFFVAFRCGFLGHDWYACDPECCNRWWCWRCEIEGPTLDNAMPSPRWSGHA